jgi:hypothetical protein
MADKIKISQVGSIETILISRYFQYCILGITILNTKNLKFSRIRMTKDEKVNIYSLQKVI